MNNTTLFKDYVNLKNKINELLEQEGVLKEAIMADLESKQLKKVEGEFGKFTVASRRVWEYSSKVEELSEKLKVAKHKEEEKGIAVVKSINPYLVWTSNDKKNKSI